MLAQRDGPAPPGVATQRGAAERAQPEDPAVVTGKAMNCACEKHFDHLERPVESKSYGFSDGICDVCGERVSSATAMCGIPFDVLHEAQRAASTWGAFHMAGRYRVRVRALPHAGPFGLEESISADFEIWNSHSSSATEPDAEGHIRFDGCTNVSMHVHLCGPKTVDELSLALKGAYWLAGKVANIDKTHDGIALIPAGDGDQKPDECAVCGGGRWACTECIPERFGRVTLGPIAPDSTITFNRITSAFKSSLPDIDWTGGNSNSAAISARDAIARAFGIDLAVAAAQQPARPSDVPVGSMWRNPRGRVYRVVEHVEGERFMVLDIAREGAEPEGARMPSREWLLDVGWTEVTTH